MPTPTDSGLDIIGIAAPLVDLGFGLAGNARVDVRLTLLGSATRTVNPITDAVTQTGGGYTVTVPGILYSSQASDTGDPVAAKTATLMLNASDLVAAGVPAGVRPRSNDKALIGGNTWTIFQSDPIPTDVIYILRLRR